MCGIAGIITFDDRFPLVQSISAMTDMLRHRGPDDEGYLLADLREGETRIFGGRDTAQKVYSSPLGYAPKEGIERAGQMRGNIALAHRRLSIIDLSPTGHQPMCNDSGTLWIIYNGEIYNYLELRRELEALGHRFVSTSDTEVLVKGYEQWGAGALNRLVGMFAFAVLDLRKRSLFLARDFFGIKPLYYTRLPEGFAFASEIKALLELPGVTRRVNPQRLYEYLRFGLTDHGGDTLYADIHQLPAAHCVEVPLDRSHSVTPERYWDIDVTRRSYLSFEEAAEQVRTLFLENIRLHLRSDVPVATALSGGIDSSAIVMAMRKLQGSALDLHAFSYIADDTLLSEDKWVDLVGGSSGALVHKIRLDPEQLQDKLDYLVYIQDEPFMSTSIFAQHSVFTLAYQTGIKVMLDGQGADESLGGYPSHFEAQLTSLLYQGKVIKAFAFLDKVSRLPGFKSRDFLLAAGGYLLPSFLQGTARLFARKELAPGWLNAAWFTDRGATLKSRRKPGGKDLFKETLHLLLTETMLPMLLRYEDRNSMAFSIESRVPFLTPKLVNLLFSLPDEYLISRDGMSKAVFRSAMRGIVPDPVLDRRDKMGFATPEKKWLITLKAWIGEELNRAKSRGLPVLNFHALEEEWRAILYGLRPLDGRMWRWINLILWAQRFNIDFD